MSVRQPRAVLTTGAGLIVPDDVQVTLTKTQASDTFRASFPMRVTVPDYWASAAPLPVAVAIDGKQVFDGQADTVDLDYTGGKISVSGRCSSAKLIDTVSNESFRNEKRGDIVRRIAGRFGLQAQVDEAADLAGTEYSTDFAHLTDNVSYWTLIQTLAELDGMVAFVRGNTLHYVKPEDEAVGVVDIWYVPPTPASHAAGNWTDLKFSRNVKLAQTINVEVNSWHPRRRQAVAVKRAIAGAAGEINYRYRHSQLSQSQAENIADRRLKENASNEITVTVNVPGNVALDPRGKINVHGTACDQQYDNTQITHTIAQGGGFRSAINAKAQSSRRGGGGS